VQAQGGGGEPAGDPGVAAPMEISQGQYCVNLKLRFQITRASDHQKYTILLQEISPLYTTL
jgi:hypothetical protein